MERAVSFVASLTLALAIAGCSLPTAALGAPDGGRSELDAVVGVHDTGLDAPAADTGLDAYVAPNDTGMDAFVVPVDVGTDAFVVPDMGHDAFVAPDAFGDASTPCDRAYGGTNQYRACSGTNGTTCVFYVNWSGGSSHSCNDRCGATRCVGAVGNQDFTQCTTQDAPFDCAQTFQDAICTCTP